MYNNNKNKNQFNLIKSSEGKHRHQQQPPHIMQATPLCVLTTVMGASSKDFIVFKDFFDNIKGISQHT